MSSPSESSMESSLPFRGAVGKPDVAVIVLLAIALACFSWRIQSNVNDLVSVFAMLFGIPAISAFWLGFRSFQVFPRLADRTWREQLSQTTITPADYWRSCVRKRLLAWALPFVTAQTVFTIIVVLSELRGDRLEILLVLLLMPMIGQLIALMGALAYFRRLLKPRPENANLALGAATITGCGWMPGLFALLQYLKADEEPVFVATTAGLCILGAIIVRQWRTCWRGLYDFE